MKLNLILFTLMINYEEWGTPFPLPSLSINHIGWGQPDHHLSICIATRSWRRTFITIYQHKRYKSTLTNSPEEMDWRHRFQIDSDHLHHWLWTLAEKYPRIASYKDIEESGPDAEILYTIYESRIFGIPVYQHTLIETAC